MEQGRKIVAVIQARMSSSRLPGKVLKPLAGMPMILFMAERVKRSAALDDIVVATSREASDDPLVEVVEGAGIACFRGDLDDVLGRLHGAAEEAEATDVVRLTGDCPLIDPGLVDRVVELLFSRGHDYVSNIDPATYPDGLDVEAFTFAALDRAWREAALPSEREHVTPFIRNPANGFDRNCIRNDVDLSALRWTVDHEDDYRLVQALVSRVDDPLAARLADFLDVMEADPTLETANVHARNEGFAVSLAKDAAIARQSRSNRA